MREPVLLQTSRKESRGSLLRHGFYEDINMAPRKKQTREERLEKKRLAERRRLAKIKSNPELHAQLKEKEHQKYLKKKRLGKIIPVSEMSPRRQKEVRRKNRESSNRYNMKKKLDRLGEEQVIFENASDNSVDSEDPLGTLSPHSSNFIAVESPPPISSHNSDNEFLPPGPVTRSARKKILSVATVDHIGIHSSENNLLTEAETFSSKKFFEKSTPKTKKTLKATNQLSDADSISPRSSPSEFISSTPRRVRVAKEIFFNHRSRLSDTETISPRSSSSDSSATISPRRRVQITKKTLPRTSIKKKSPWKHLLRQIKYKADKELQIKETKIQKLKMLNDKYKKQLMRMKQYQTGKERIKKRILNNDQKKKDLAESCRQYIKMSKTEVQRDIEKFLEDDENSRVCSGKKEFITKNKIKKQKRYLNFNLLQLHQKFLKQYPEHKISYSFFCSIRPFWIVIPNVKSRETCLCIIHENMDLVVKALKKTAIITESSPDKVLKSLCCDSRNVKCLSRLCDTCQNRSLNYKEFDNSIESHYWIWTKCKKKYTKNGQEKVTVQSLKQKKSAFPKDIIQHFENLITPYMRHCANIICQYKYIKELKTKLKANQCIVHCDFSENYCTKYASEIQAFHFGSSRQQITLHTAVIYYLNKNGVLCTKSFCSMSECLRHDAVAIWEHLMPILDFIKTVVSEMESLYFLSDSPSAQYRNRKMFYVMSKLHWDFPSLHRVIWNYSEKGHGKGAPDGVGGVLKRTADQLVAHGSDIPNIDTLISHLKDKCQGVSIVKVEESKILERELLIPVNLKEFRGTMDVHQVFWSRDNYEILAMRRLSCDLGNCSEESVQCPHGQHIGFYNIGKEACARKNKAKNDSLIKRSRPAMANPDRSESNLTTRDKNQPNKCVLSDDSFSTEILEGNEKMVSNSKASVVFSALHGYDSDSDEDMFFWTKGKEAFGKLNPPKSKIDSQLIKKSKNCNTVIDKSTFTKKNKAKNDSLIKRSRPANPDPINSNEPTENNNQSDKCVLFEDSFLTEIPRANKKMLSNSKVNVVFPALHGNDSDSDEDMFFWNKGIEASGKIDLPKSKIESTINSNEPTENNNQSDKCVLSDDSFWIEIPSANEKTLSKSMVNIVFSALHGKDSDSDEDNNIFF